MDIAAVLAAAVQSQASDIHLQEGRLPLLRLGAELFPWGNHRVGGEDISAWLQALGQPFDGRPYVSTAFSWDGRVRCRLHGSREQAGVHVVVRILYPLDTLPPDGDELLLRRLSGLDDGLVLVCGPTGSGKTTALWRILCWANANRRCHIITLEDPIEYVVPGELALISQREYGIHFQSFAEGVREALRQDPDILLVGEMRDRETMDAALTAAETGHLVFATLHTCSAAQAVSRMAGAYAGAEQEEMRCRLAMVLQGILAQRRRDGADGAYIAREILLHTPAVAQLIRSGREHQLATVMQTGAALGMRTMEQALQRHRRNLI